MNFKKILLSAVLVLVAIVLLGQQIHLTVPPGKGWNAALRNAGLPETPENVAVLQGTYGNPQPESYVFPVKNHSAPVVQVSAGARQAPSAISLPQTNHVIGPGDTFLGIATRYYGHTLNFVSGEHRAGIVAQYAATIAFMNKYHDGATYTKTLSVGDTLWLPPANPLKLYDQEDYVVGYAHYMLLGDTYYGITNRWYSGVQGFRILNYNHV